MLKLMFLQEDSRSQDCNPIIATCSKKNNSVDDTVMANSELVSYFHTNKQKVHGKICWKCRINWSVPLLQTKVLKNRGKNPRFFGFRRVRQCQNCQVAKASVAWQHQPYAAEPGDRRGKMPYKFSQITTSLRGIILHMAHMLPRICKYIMLL